MTGRPTIADVASRSGVSTATVSRVLSGATSSRPTTRARVLAAAKELDYKPSAVARALKVQATKTIGLLVADIQNPFFPQLVSAIEAEAVDRGYGLVLCNPSDDAARELAAIDLLIERRVDGIMVASSRAMRRHASLLREIGVPVVLLNSGRVEGLPSIDTAQRRGARLAADHLLDLGHRRIGHITAPRTNAAAADRLAGARDAVRAFGGGDDAELFVADGDSHVEGGAAAAVRLVTIARCTGIVCYNDLTAIGALRGVRSTGMRVPEDVGIVGFDDIDLAAWIDPPLTTVRQPTAAMGRWAVDRLVRLATGETPDGPTSVHLEPELVIRGSTARVSL
jgi:LacI family transcriptional regulator